MSLGANFTRVTLGDDPATGGKALLVEGVSEPPSKTSEIFVALPHDGELRSALADNPQSSRWRATVPEGTSSFPTDGEILVIGIAIGPAPDHPFVWEENLQIESDA